MSGEGRTEFTAGDARTFEYYLDQETNRAVRKGGVYSAILGTVGALSIVFMIEVAGGRGLEGPLVFTLFATAYSFLLYLIARADRMRGVVLYLAFLPFAALPSLFFIGTHFYYPAGAATFITGPFSYLNFHLVIMTGFIFNMRLSVLAGLVAGGGFMIASLLALPEFQRLGVGDALLHQELTFPSIWIIKGLMIVGSGPVVGLLSSTTRRLLLRILHEEREKESVSRLFGQFVSPEVKDRVLADRAGVIGDRKRVVILFSDIRGFTAYSESAEPTELVTRLNRYFDRMVDAIHRQGGTVDKFIGDAIMAVFGGLVEIANPAEAALKAAMEMRESLEALNAGWVEEGLVPMHAGIGLHLGEVLMGTIGSEHRKDFTVIGDAVNTAARIESQTREHPESILYSGAVHVALTPELRNHGRYIGELTLKGKSRPVAVYGV